jgi:hypothetical protein
MISNRRNAIMKILRKDTNNTLKMSLKENQILNQEKDSNWKYKLTHGRTLKIWISKYFLVDKKFFLGIIPANNTFSLCL